MNQPQWKIISLPHYRDEPELDKKLLEAMENVSKILLKNMQSLNPVFAKIVSDHFWELV